MFGANLAITSTSTYLLSITLQNPACRELDQIWAQLSKEWEGHPVGLVARVDCADHRSQILCEEYAFTTLPILMYGDPDSPEFYEKEDRSFKALSAFAKEHISKPPCNVLNLHNCDQKERQLLEDLMKKPREDLEEMERKAEERIGELEKKLDAKIQEIQAQYTKLVSEFNEQIDKVRKQTNYKWLQQVLHEMDIRMAEEGVEF